MTTIWTPHLTVAAIIERDGTFLLVEENADGQIVLNQPAGHVEENESLGDAVIRETLEESGRHFTPEAITGFYRWRNLQNGITYLRIVYCGQCSEPERDFQLDSDIITTHWMNLEQLQARSSDLRSPLVMRGFRDYLSGQRYPLDLVNELADSLKNS